MSYIVFCNRRGPDNLVISPPWLQTKWRSYCCSWLCCLIKHQAAGLKQRAYSLYMSLYGEARCCRRLWKVQQVKKGSDACKECSCLMMRLCIQKALKHLEIKVYGGMKGLKHTCFIPCCKHFSWRDYWERQYFAPIVVHPPNKQPPKCWSSIHMRCLETQEN